ncbi:hypothetical protein [Halorussus sp. GCM10023401]|uniref:hypothetical protein n=1 Tax=Halorussus sp. GCM10023401 TaxID=3252680 RepID=UPI0036115C1B
MRKDRSADADGVTRRSYLELAGVVGAAGILGSSFSTVASAATTNSKDFYYTGSARPSSPSTHDFFYDTVTGEISYYDGSEWQVFTGDKTVWDVQSRMEITGSTADTAFSAALSNASPGDTILFRDRSTPYTLTQQYDIQKGITIKGEGDATLELNHSNSNVQIRFKGGGIQANTGIASSVAAGSRNIPVNDASIFTAGDRVMLHNDSYSQQVNTEIHFGVVQSTSSGSIELDTATFYDFQSSSNGGTVSRVNLCKSPRVESIKATGSAERMFEFKWCENPTYKDLTVTGYTQMPMRAEDSWKPIWRDVEARNPTSRNAAEGEVIQIYRCGDAGVYSPRIYECRRGIDFAWGSYGATIVDPVIHNFSLHGISVHGPDITGNVSVFGGTLIADPTGQTGNGITGSPYENTEFHVEGTHIKTRRAGLKCNCEFTAHNVHIETVPDTSNGQGVRVTSSDVHLSDIYIDYPGSQNSLAPIYVRADNRTIENVSIDATVDSSNTTIVQVLTRNGGTVDGIKFRGQIQSDTSASGRAVTFDASGGRISRVDWSMDIIDHGDNCIVLEGDEGFEDFKLHDCTIETTGNACFATAASGSNQASDYFWVKNCYMTGSASVSLDEPVDHAWIVDNKLAGLVDSGVTNLEKRGNFIN